MINQTEHRMYKKTFEIAIGFTCLTVSLGSMHKSTREQAPLQQ